MKKLFTVALSLLAFSAVAGEIKVYDVYSSTLFYSTTITPEFGINKDLGRAWVNITFQTVTDGPMIEDERVKIAGLTYNKETQEIVLDAEGAQTVCAKVKFRRIFGTDIRPTGNCKFSQKYYDVQVDNGYEVETLQRFKITMKF